MENKPFNHAPLLRFFRHIQHPLIAAGAVIGRPSNAAIGRGAIGATAFHKVFDPSAAIGATYQTDGDIAWGEGRHGAAEGIARPQAAITAGTANEGGQGFSPSAVDQ